MAAVPWQFGAEPGAKRARVLTPEEVVELIKASKRPLLVAGSRSVEGSGAIDLSRYAVDLAKALDAPLVVSPGIISRFKTHGYPKIVGLGLLDLVNYLRDPDWRGFDNDGGYDLAVFLGGLYYFQNLILSSIKNFSKVKTLTLDRFYYPNATYSLQNLPERRWVEALGSILKGLGAGEDG